jgi:phage regulator Rha-like protein
MEMTELKLKKRVTMLMLNKKMLALLKWKRNNLLKMMPKKFKKFKRTKQKVRMLVIKMETMRNLRMFP